MSSMVSFEDYGFEKLNLENMPEVFLEDFDGYIVLEDCGACDNYSDALPSLNYYQGKRIGFLKSSHSIDYYVKVATFSDRKRIKCIRSIADKYTMSDLDMRDLLEMILV